MPNPSMENRKVEVERCIRLLEEWQGGFDDLDQGFLDAQVISTSYLVVTAYGVVESEMKKLLYSMDPGRLSMSIKDYREWVSTKYTWDFGRIKEVLERADPGLKNAARDTLTRQQKDSITSLRGQRDKVAHGAPYDTNFDEVKKQFVSAIEGLHVISDIIADEAA